MGIETALIAAASLGGAALSARGARRAADTQAAAANDANRLQWDMYMQNREDMAPWRDAGRGVLPQLVTGLEEGGKFNRDFTMEDFQKDPGYDFRLSEGTKALERSRAAHGKLYGAGTGKALQRYGQEFASGEYTNAFNRYMMQRNAQYNRLAGLAGTGQTATEQLANQGMNTANVMGNNLIGAGNARASGYVGRANAINSGMNNMWNAYWMNQGGGGGATPYFQYPGGTPQDPAYG